MENIIKDLIDDLYSDFRERSKEVMNYVDFSQKISSTRSLVLSKKDNNEVKNIDDYEIDRDLIKTIRASGYLLLYNLVESTLSNAIDVIHQAIDVYGCEYNSLNKNLQNIVLSNFGKIIGTVAGKREMPHPIQQAVVKMGYDKEKLFSGNIDCKEIKRMSKKYGFDVPDPNLKGRQIGAFILEVKSKRNSLAHGSISFELCGRETPPEHLIELSYKTIVYLRAIMRSISYFVRNKHFVRLA